MPITQDEFRAALSRFPSGVTVITAKDASGKFHGMTVSAFNSVSIDPPLILICVDRSTATHNVLTEAGVFAVNILSAEQGELSEHFASPCENKFIDIEYHLGGLGLPLLSGCLVNLECRVRNTGDGGDHTIFIAEVESSIISEGDPLLYFRSNYREIGAG